MTAATIQGHAGAETCGMCLPSGSPPCGKPAEYRVLAGCKHGHDLSDSHLCLGCVQVAERSGTWRCTPCRDAEPGHACFVNLRFEWTGVLV